MPLHLNEVQASSFWGFLYEPSICFATEFPTSTESCRAYRRRHGYRQHHKRGRGVCVHLRHGL